MKIIIIEDEGITRQWLKKKLEELSGDYHVEGVFSNGSMALDYLACAKNVDVVFTDIRMPVMDGLEFLEKLLEMGLKPYKVILSAYDEFHYARQAIRLGAQEFVLKPEITKESLKQILDAAAKYLEQKQVDKEETQIEETENKKGAVFAELVKQGMAGAEELTRVLGENIKEQEISKLVFAEIYLEKQVSCEAVEELLAIFLEQEQLQGAFFWADNQTLILGYLHNKEGERLQLMDRLGNILQVHTGIRPYLGISRMQGDGNQAQRGTNQLIDIKEMCRQAAAARENRVFFGLCGAWQYDDMRVYMKQEAGELYFNQDIKEIMKYLYQADYAKAAQKVEDFLHNVQKASYLHPTYVKALCDEILSAYRHNLWEYGLNDDEKERVEGAKLLISREMLNLQKLLDAVKSEEDYLCNLLQKKRGNMQYSASVKEVMEYVEDHMGERISLEQMADKVFLSKPYLSTLFKKETGRKFSSYLQEVRLEKSRTLLKDTRLSVGKIAEQVGFFDSAHFSRAFKDHYGCSPLEYRKTK